MNDIILDTVDKQQLFITKVTGFGKSFETILNLASQLTGKDKQSPV